MSVRIYIYLLLTFIILLFFPENCDLWIRTCLFLINTHKYWIVIYNWRLYLFICDLCDFVPYIFYPILFVNLNAFLFHMNEFWCSIMMMTKTSRHNTSCLHLTRKCLLEEASWLKWRADWRIKCLLSEKNKKAPTGHGSNAPTSKLMLSNI